MTDYSPSDDYLDDTALAGWDKKYIDILDAKKRVTGIRIQWIKPDDARQIITLNLNGVTSSGAIRFSGIRDIASDSSFTADPNSQWELNLTGNNSQVTTGNGDDQVTIAGSGNVIRTLGGNNILASTGSANALYGASGKDSIFGGNADTLIGGSGQDSIFLGNAQGAVSVDGGIGNDNILLDSIAENSAITLRGGSGEDSLTFASATSLTIDADGNLASIGMDRKTLAIDNGFSTNFEAIIGSADADSIDASSTTNAHEIIRYKTGGGNDLYKGGDAQDIIYLHDLDANSRVSLDGGGDTGPATDWLYLGNQSVSLTLVDNTDATALQVNGQEVSQSTITGFEGYGFGDQADRFTANSQAIASILGRTDLYVNAGAGNDTISLGEIRGAAGELRIDAGAGDDLVSVGQLAKNAMTGARIIDGGAGLDTITFNTAADQGLFLSINENGSLASYSYFAADAVADPDVDPDQEVGNMDTPGADLTLRNFEVYQGSDQANFVDASSFHGKAGLDLELRGGSGDDQFYLGELKEGSVIIASGDGDDCINLQAGSQGYTSIHDSAGEDTIKFHGLAPTVGANSLWFALDTSDSENLTLKIAGVDGRSPTVSGSNRSGILAYTVGKADGMGADRLELYSVSSPDDPLASIDLADVVTKLQQSGSGFHQLRLVPGQNSGSTVPGSTIGKGQSQDVQNGQTVKNTVLLSEGVQTITDGGNAIGTQVYGGGQQVVAAGGTATGTYIREGHLLTIGQWVEAGGEAIDCVIGAGAEQYVWGYALNTAVSAKDAFQSIVSGGRADNSLLKNGGKQSVGGIAFGTLVQKDGHQLVVSAGYASNTIVESGGDLEDWGTSYVVQHSGIAESPDNWNVTILLNGLDTKDITTRTIDLDFGKLTYISKNGTDQSIIVSTHADTAPTIKYVGGMEAFGDFVDAKTPTPDQRAEAIRSVAENAGIAFQPTSQAAALSLLDGEIEYFGLADGLADLQTLSAGAENSPVTLDFATVAGSGQINNQLLAGSLDLDSLTGQPGRKDDDLSLLSGTENKMI